MATTMIISTKAEEIIDHLGEGSVGRLQLSDQRFSNSIYSNIILTIKSFMSVSFSLLHKVLFLFYNTCIVNMSVHT